MWILAAVFMRTDFLSSQRLPKKLRICAPRCAGCITFPRSV